MSCIRTRSVYISLQQTMQTDVDAERYKQCLDYLGRYGSYYQHVLFVSKQRGLRDAITTFKQMVILYSFVSKSPSAEILNPFCKLSRKSSSEIFNIKSIACAR